MSLMFAAGVPVRLGGTTVLHDVDLDISPGEIVTIVGPNGSGKSTMLRALIGAVPLSAGKVRRKPGLRLGYVPQKFQIDATMPITVARFLDLPRPAPAPASERAESLSVAGAGDLSGRQMTDLSGGQFQRVFLARALLGTPEILLLDEPTKRLDQAESSAFYRTIEGIRTRLGCAVLMVSHELHVVMSASDRVVCLNGHVCCHGTPDVVARADAYRALFGTGTQGALALYRHEHTHSHDDGPDDGHVHGDTCDHSETVQGSR